MVIVVEGIDRVGKTTLVDMLHKVTGFPVYKNNTQFKLSDMDNENETDKMIKMLQLCALGSVNVIFDRFHWTDMVYGVIQRAYDYDIAVKNKSIIEGLLHQMGAMIVLVEPVDVIRSSEEHGGNLVYHNALFDELYDDCTLCKYACNFYTLDDAKMWVMSNVKNQGVRHG